MSYAVTMYFNDADIARTNAKSKDSGLDITCDYKSPAYTREFSGSITFTATPADDCRFKRWVYRVVKAGEKEEDAEQQFSYENPFVFTDCPNGASVIIRAEGQISEKISIHTIGHKGLILKITNIDTEYDGSTRDVSIAVWEEPIASIYPADTYTGTLENGVDSSGGIWIIGLSPGVLYKISCRISNIDDSADAELVEYVTTLPYDGLTGDEEISIEKIGEDEVELKITNIDAEYNDTTRRYYIEFWEYPAVSNPSSPVATRSGPIDKGMDSTHIIRITGLSPGVTYRIVCELSNVDCGCSHTITDYVTTDIPYWNLEDYNDEIEISDDYWLYSGSSSEHTFYRYKIRFTQSGRVLFYNWMTATYMFLTTTSTYNYTLGIPNNILASNQNIELEGQYDPSFSYVCRAGVTYYLWFRHIKSDVGYTEVMVRPQWLTQWSWDQSNDSATKYQTEKAYNAVKNNGNTEEFSYKVWNDMVYKTGDITYELFGEDADWDSHYASYGRTLMASKGEKLTAVMFNSLRNNLELAGIKVGLSKIPEAADADNAIAGTVPHPVASGDKVFGHYFITLTDYMNDCIEKINLGYENNGYI